LIIGAESLDNTKTNKAKKKLIEPVINVDDMSFRALSRKLQNSQINTNTKGSDKVVMFFQQYNDTRKNSGSNSQRRQRHFQMRAPPQ